MHIGYTKLESSASLDNTAHTIVLFAAYILWKLRLNLVWPWEDLSNVSSTNTDWQSNMARRINQCPSTVVLREQCFKFYSNQCIW